MCSEISDIRGAATSRVARALRGALALASVGACVSVSTATLTTDAGKQLTIVASADAGVSSEAGVDAAPLHTSLRLALFAPSRFGVDICLRGAAEQTFEGPLLYSQLPALPDGGADAKAHDANRETGTEPLDAGSSDATISHDAARDAGRDASVDARLGDVAVARYDARYDAGYDAQHDSGRIDASATTHDGGTASGGVLPGQVSGYLSVSGAGTFDLGVVVGGRGSCAAPIVIQRVTFDAGKFSTVMVVALPPPSEAGADAASSGGPFIVALTDEPAIVESAARARFVNVTTPGGGAPSLGVTAVFQSQSIPLAANVAPGLAAAPSAATPPVDLLGYWTDPPLSNPFQLRIGPIAMDAGPTPWTSASANFDMSAGSNHTGFILGSGGVPASILWCNDEESLSVLTSCVSIGGT